MHNPIENEVIDSEENIVRAVLECHYDKEKKRLSSLLFRNGNISVSRLSILALNELISIFRSELVRNNNPLRSVGEINVGDLIELGIKHNQVTELSVIAKPTSTNPAHAEIPQKIPRSLAGKIIDALKIHNVE